MKNLQFLAAAYAVIWLLIGGYILRLSNKIKELNTKIEQIESDIKK